MYLNDTACCAVMEIGDLSHHKTPREAMLAFCEQTLDEGYGYHEPGELSGLYTFTGVVKHTDGTKVSLGGRYGPAFATFIRRNHLGRVTESISARNRVNHPTHVVRVWVWAPSERKLKHWYKENKER